MIGLAQNFRISFNLSCDAVWGTEGKILLNTERNQIIAIFVMYLCIYVFVCCKNSLNFQDKSKH